MDDRRLERIEDKVDSLGEKVSSLSEHMGVYNEQLKIHIEGTVQNRSDIKNLQKQANMVNGALKFIGVLAALGAVYEILARIV